MRLDHIIMGMKELPLMFYPCSSLDPSEGIRFRGLSIPEMQQKLPKIGKEPLPEAAYWLLLTGESPTETELKDLQQSLTHDVSIPQSTEQLIKKNAKDHHGMTLLSMALLDLQQNSIFFNKYQKGEIKKSQYWESTYDDSI